MISPHPLITRLVDEYACPLLTEADLDAWLQTSGDGVLFCVGDPLQFPEALDVAVVLPELMRAFVGRFRVAVADRELEAELQTRFGFSRWPSLLFVRDGGYTGVLSGMLDWSVYLARIQDLLSAPVSRPPSIGIPVSSSAGSAASHCH